jgi:hypothetical protein
MIDKETPPSSWAGKKDDIEARARQGADRGDHLGLRHVKTQAAAKLAGGVAMIASAATEVEVEGARIADDAMRPVRRLRKVSCQAAASPCALRAPQGHSHQE